jgi:hypothetical protein
VLLAVTLKHTSLSTLTRDWRACVLLAVNVDVHPVGIILKSNLIKDIRFSIPKGHWKSNRSVYNRLPDHNRC